MLFMEMVELLELIEKTEASELVKAFKRVFDEYDIPERVEGDSRQNVYRVEAFTRALLIELKEGGK